MPDVAMHSLTEKIVEKQLDCRVEAIEKVMSGDVITFMGSLLDGSDVVFRDQVEDIATNGRRKKLIVILETTGGHIEVVQRIAETLRYHYKRVEFIVPNFAMSAGTVLVMSGDAIHMDYFSILGPIDPQVETVNGQQVPALGYLVQYERLLKKAEAGTLNTAELTFLVEKFDAAELYLYEQARELSIRLLKEWLVNFEFKEWTKTETRGIRVTPRLRRQRAASIARTLNKSDHWHSHGRGSPWKFSDETLNCVLMISERTIHYEKISDSTIISCEIT